jgi:hypothetical protein
VTILPTIVTLYPLNTQIIEVDGVTDATSGDYLNDATGSATLLDYRGRPDPIINNLAMPYVTGSNGNYKGVVPDTFDAAVGSGYTLQIQITQGPVQVLWSLPTVVKLRTQ